MTSVVSGPGPLWSQRDAELDQAVLAVLEDLETSLCASQKALLARDLDGIEQGTQEQTRLVRALSILTAPDAAWANRENAKQGSANQEDTKEGRANEVNANALKKAKRRARNSQLLSAQMRVWHAARVQAALLRRAQRSLQILSRLLAGPQAGYGPPQSPVNPRALFAEGKS